MTVRYLRCDVCKEPLTKANINETEEDPTVCIYCATDCETDEPSVADES